MAKAKRKAPDQEAQRAGETYLQWQARLAAQRDYAASKLQAPVTPEAARHGQYEEGYTEVDGQRRRVLINRGGSTIQRWMSARPCDILGDSERAAIRYCQKLWARLDYKGPRAVIVDFGGAGEAEHEALGELSALKRKLGAPAYWDVFENICRSELASERKRDKVTVGFVAGKIAEWRRL